MGRVDDEVKRRGRQALASLRRGAPTMAARHAEAEVGAAVTDDGRTHRRSPRLPAAAARGGRRSHPAARLPGRPKIRRHCSCRPCSPSPTRRAASARPRPPSTSVRRLPRSGFRVLVVDLDPQGNATTGLGLNARDVESSVYDVRHEQRATRGLHRAHEPQEPLRGTGDDRPRRRRDRAGAGDEPRAQAAPAHRRGPRRLRHHPDRLPALARAPHRQRPGRRRRR